LLNRTNSAAVTAAVTLQTDWRQTNNKEKAKRQTHTQGNNKNNEGKQKKKHNWKHAECDHVEKKKAKDQRSIILQANKHRIYYTPEDGHVDRNMYERQ
jgi:hypothetical protein